MYGDGINWFCAGLTYFPIRHEPSGDVLTARISDVIMSTYNENGNEEQQWFLDRGYIRNK